MRPGSAALRKPLPCGGWGEWRAEGDGVGHGGVWLGWETTEQRPQRE
jgi:hypothetical protein